MHTFFQHAKRIKEGEVSKGGREGGREGKEGRKEGGEAGRRGRREGRKEGGRGRRGGRKERREGGECYKNIIYYIPLKRISLNEIFQRICY